MRHPLCLLLVLALCACAPMREDVVAAVSTAFDRPTETSLGRAFVQAQQRHRGESGFRLLNNGVSALMTRAALIDQAERSIDFQTFIFDSDETGAFMLDHLIAAAGRGVRVRILYEYRADARRPEPAGHRLHLGRSDSALHAKIVVYDRRRLWVGSANFDPRSRHLNTEIGVMIDSPPLAEVVLNGIAPDFAPSRSWRLEANPGAATGPVAWVGEKDGAVVRLETEPDADLWRGLKTLFYSMLPGIEELL